CCPCGSAAIGQHMVRAAACYCRFKSICRRVGYRRCLSFNGAPARGQRRDGEEKAYHKEHGHEIPDRKDSSSRNPACIEGPKSTAQHPFTESFEVAAGKIRARNLGHQDHLPARIAWSLVELPIFSSNQHFIK